MNLTWNQHFSSPWLETSEEQHTGITLVVQILILRLIQVSSPRCSPRIKRDLSHLQGRINI